MKKNDIYKTLKFKVHKLHSDPNFRDVLLNTIKAFLLKVTGSALAFGFSVCVARLLGAKGAGLYFLALSITTVGSVIGRVGLDNALLRFVATHAAKEEWSKVKGIHTQGIRLAFIVSASVSLIGFFTSDYMAILFFKQPEMGEPIRWMSLSILPFSIINLQAESLKGLKLIKESMILQSIGVPFLSLIFIWPLAQIAHLNGVIWSYLISTLLISLLGACWWHNTKAAKFKYAILPSVAELWSTCRHFWGIAIVNGAILPIMPLFLLGRWSTSEEVGIFGAALRIATLVSFFLVAVSNVVAPKFAKLYIHGELESLSKLARQSSLLLTTLASPLLILMLLAGNWVMSLYGKDFSSGGGVLAILAIGQLVNAFCGPVGNLLMMSGHEQALRNITFFTFIVQLTLCLVLIPYFGMFGAAIAACSAVITNNMFAVICVRKYIGIDYPIKLRRG